MYVRKRIRSPLTADAILTLRAFIPILNAFFSILSAFILIVTKVILILKNVFSINKINVGSELLETGKSNSEKQTLVPRNALYLPPLPSSTVSGRFEYIMNNPFSC